MNFQSPFRIEAQDEQELLQRLRAPSTAVPRRGKGRRKTHTEPWIVQTLFPALCAATLLDYPLVAELRSPPDDRPDVFMVSGSREIGLEVTEAVPEWLARAEAIRDRNYPGVEVRRSLFPDDATPSSEEIRDKIAESPRPESPLYGDAVERAWAALVDQAILKKIEDCAKPGFHRYPESWLAVYHSPRALALRLNVAHAHLNSLQSALMHFDRLLLFSDNKMLLVDHAGPQTMELSDLEPDA